MSERKKPGPQPGTFTPVSHRQKGSGGRRLHITIDKDVADVLPESNEAARAFINGMLREKKAGNTAE